MNNDDWGKLFDLIPEIERTTNFGEMIFSGKSQENIRGMPYVDENQLVYRFRNIVQELGIAPVFDWSGWDEGRKLLNDRETDFSTLEMDTLCKLLTVVIRNDRFVEGYLVEKFQDGTVLRIVKGLEKQYER